ncbi:MAG: 2-oxo acid dehydrogenase subunit E2, partial [Chromatiaceae bacterium]
MSKRTPVVLPPFGEGVATAELSAWLVQPGTQVTRGQELAEVQTAKAALVVESPATGTLLELVAQPGDEMAVGATIAWLGSAEETAAAADGPPADLPHTGIDRSEPIQDVGTAIVSEGALPGTAGAGFASPRLRARLAELGLRRADVAGVAGTGHSGRVTAADLERFVADLARQKGEPAPPLRRAVADAMLRSWTRPLATVAREIHLDALLRHRRRIEGRPALTLYAVRALAMSLAADDRLARKLVGDYILRPADIAIAVAVADEDGIRTPSLAHPHRGALAELCARWDAAFAAVQAGRRSPEEAVSPIAAVSNYGTLNLTWATPIPLPDHSLLLGVGAVAMTPVWDPARQVWGRGASCELTLTFDHRVADGAAAAAL